MSVVVPAVLHCRAITEEMIGPPCHHVSLTSRNIYSAVWAAIRFLSSMRRNFAHKPLCASTELFAGPAIRKPGDIAGWFLGRTLVLTRAALTRHDEGLAERLPPVVRLPELVGALPAAIATVRIADCPAEVRNRIVAVTRDLTAG